MYTAQVRSSASYNEDLANYNTSQGKKNKKNPDLRVQLLGNIFSQVQHNIYIFSKTVAVNGERVRTVRRPLEPWIQK